jgi:hypothetical protein
METRRISMKWTWIAVPAVLILLLVCVAEAQYSDFIPNWGVGDKWEVETHPLAYAMPRRTGGPVVERIKDQKVIVSFEVLAVKDLEGVECFEVKISNTLLADQHYLMYIRKKAFTLKQLVEVRTAGTGETRTVTENPSQPFIYTREGILIPLDFPQFPNEDKDGELEFQVGFGSKKAVQKATYSKKGEELTIELITTFNKKKLRSVQIWKKGYPWWSEAKRYLDGKEQEVGTIKKG